MPNAASLHSRMQACPGRCRTGEGRGEGRIRPSLRRSQLANAAAAEDAGAHAPTQRQSHTHRHTRGPTHARARGRVGARGHTHTEDEKRCETMTADGMRFPRRGRPKPPNALEGDRRGAAPAPLRAGWACKTRRARSCDFAGAVTSGSWGSVCREIYRRVSRMQVCKHETFHVYRSVNTNDSSVQVCKHGTFHVYGSRFAAVAAVPPPPSRAGPPAPAAAAAMVDLAGSIQTAGAGRKAGTCKRSGVGTGPCTADL